MARFGFETSSVQPLKVRSCFWTESEHSLAETTQYGDSDARCWRQSNADCFSNGSVLMMSGRAASVESDLVLSQELHSYSLFS